MTDPITPERVTLTERIKALLDEHVYRWFRPGGQWECHCGASGPSSDHRAHVAEVIAREADVAYQAARKWGELNRDAAKEQSDRADKAAADMLTHLEARLSLVAQVRALADEWERGIAADGLPIAEAEPFLRLLRQLRALVAAVGDEETAT